MHMNFHITQSAALLTLLILICVPASAYYLSIDTPSEVKAGETILVTGKTDIPPPDKVEIVLSHSINIPIEIERHAIQISERGETEFNVSFDTEGLEKGNYKVEALAQNQRSFSSGSRTIRVVKLVDRSDMVRFTSSQWQEFDEILEIEGRISGYAENAVQMQVDKDGNIIFGPESIPVSRGEFKSALPIKEGGNYEVIFSDYSGFIGRYSFHVEKKQPSGISPVSTHEETPAPTGTSPVSDVTQKPVESDSKKPVSSIGERISGVSASADVSRDNPAYFVVKLTDSPVTIQTCDLSDWVFEYKRSGDDPMIRVNEHMGTTPETVVIENAGGELYLKVYPYSFKATEKVTITADSAESITLSNDAAKAFGVPPRYGSESKDTPFPIIGFIAGILSVMILVGKRKK